jgi:hypothetical protein
MRDDKQSPGEDGVRRLGYVRVRLSRETAAARAKRLSKTLCFVAAIMLFVWTAGLRQFKPVRRPSASRRSPSATFSASQLAFTTPRSGLRIT